MPGEEKRPVMGLETALNNSLLSALREAKLTVNQHLPIMGEKRFLDYHLALLKPGIADIPYPLERVDFEFVAKKGGELVEVLMLVPAHGDVTIFHHLPSQFMRTAGVIGTSQKRGLYITYRATQFMNAQQLHQLFIEDLDLLRQFLTRIESIHERFQDQLRTQLKELMLEVRPEVETTLDLAMELEKFGYRRHIEGDDSYKRYFVTDKAKKPSGG